jgi:hypothetical protein
MARSVNTVVLAVQSPAGCLYRIEADKYGFHCFEQAFDADGNEVLTDEGAPRFKLMACPHYGTLKGACKRLLEEGLRAEDSVGLSALMFRMDAWTQAIVDAIGAGR